MKRNILFAAALTLMAVASQAAVSPLAPEFVMPAPGDHVILNRMSDNGKWAVSETGSVTDGDLRPIGGVLFNLETLEQTPITHQTGYAGVNDVTNDGAIVVGQFNSKPGFWSKATGQWTAVTLDAGYNCGALLSVTPDGKRAVGWEGKTNDEMVAHPIVVDIETNTRVPLTNLPTRDMAFWETKEETTQNCPTDITPDGKKFCGMLSQSILLPVSMCVYVYDIEEQTYDFVGFTPNDFRPWTPQIQYTYFMDRPSLSNNGEWMTGIAYMVQPIPGNDLQANEDNHAFLYNLNTKELTIYSETSAADYAGFTPLNDGTLIAATPAVNPYANSMIRSGKYFISFEQICKQIYGIENFEEATGFVNSGKCIGASDDGLTLLMLPGLSDTYLVRLKEPILTAADRVDLLANFSVTPAEGTVMAQIRQLSFVFDREVKTKGNPRKITFSDAAGTDVVNPLSTNGMVAEGKKLTLTFRTKDLKEGEEYTLTIPEGMFSIDGDAETLNKEIKVKYTGRANTPVAMTQIYPEADSYVSIFDLTTNPVVIDFDANVQLVEGSYGYLYKDEDSNPYCTLALAAARNQLLVYPAVPQYLYEGTDYRIVIPEGCVTDLSGAGPNDEIEFIYHGIFRREIVQSDKFLFNDDCSNYANFLFYEGDELQPDFVTGSWGFDSTTTPWLCVRSSEETSNMALGSTSMYAPPGQADDWLVTPQLKIPDADCRLEFDAQSYLFDTEDYLKVYVYPCDNVYNTLTPAIVDDMRASHLVFNERLTPGEAEETLENDWTHYTVDLAQFAGQNVYIAFVNNNDDQSAIFLDNIAVIHELPYLATFENASRVVAADNITIKGNVVFASDLETYTTADLALYDADGNEISTISQKGLSLTKGDVFNFEFANPLPLKIGEINPYKVAFKFNDAESETLGTVRDLLFQPNRKIVLEEYTGADCVNCPLGVRGIENIQSLYPGVLIPITIHTYENDPLGTGMQSYSQSLGLDGLGAPSGTINRTGGAYPMISVNGDYRFTGAGIKNDVTGRDEEVWLDIFNKEYAQPAEMSVEFKSTLDPLNLMAYVDLKFSNALNIEASAYNVYAVAIENDVPTYQKNGFSSITDEDLGDWRAGGKFGSTLIVPYFAQDVARATWGNSVNGTAGIIPAKQVAGQTYGKEIGIELPALMEDRAINLNNCEVVVMVIDTSTGKVVNANKAPIDGETSLYSGVDNITADNNAEIGITLLNGKLMVNAPGKYNAVACDLAGGIVANFNGDGLGAVSLAGYKGILLVKVSAENGQTRTAKILVK